MFFVGYVSWDDEEAKGDPCEEGVDREERAVVEEDSGPADHGGK